MAVVFAQIGQNVHITGRSFEDAVNEGSARRAYASLRKSVLSPLEKNKHFGQYARRYTYKPLLKANGYS